MLPLVLAYFLFFLLAPFILFFLIIAFLFQFISYENFKGKLGISIPKNCYPNKPSIWLHFSSLGEYQTNHFFLKQLVKSQSTLLKKNQKKFLITYFNQDTSKIIEQDWPNLPSLFFPLENPFSYQKIIKKFNINKVIFFETEIWPFFLMILFKKKIQAYLINGCLQNNSFIHYQKIKKFISFLSKAYQHVFTQDFNEKEKFLKIGFSKNQISVGHNLKYLQGFSKVKKKTDYKKKLSFPKNSFIITLGSIHFKEDILILKQILPLLKNNPHFYFILAPREIKKTKPLFKFLQKNNVKFTKRTEKKNQKKKNQLLILNTYGELASIYSISDLVIIGGSFIPIGGHNPLEAIHYNKKVIVGPYMNHFKNIIKNFNSYISTSTLKDLPKIIDQSIKKNNKKDYGKQLLEKKRKEAISFVKNAIEKINH